MEVPHVPSAQEILNDILENHKIPSEVKAGTEMSGSAGSSGRKQDRDRGSESGRNHRTGWKGNNTGKRYGCDCDHSGNGYKRSNSQS